MFKKIGFAIVVVVSFALILALRLNAKADHSMENGREEAIHQTLRGMVTSVEQGKDGVQVLLETDEGDIYSITISVMQAEISGELDQIVEGAEIEFAGTEIAGMEPTLIVAEFVTLLEGE